MNFSSFAPCKVRFERLAIPALFVAVAIAAAPGCGGSTASTPTSACTDYSQVVCNQLAQCNTLEFQAQFAGSVSGCVADFVPACTSALQVPGTGYTPAVLEACGKALSAQSCDEAATKAPAACAVPAGTLADGESCSNDDQCKGGSCQEPVPNGPVQEADAGTSCGKCAEKSTAGTCAADTDCPGNEICVYGGTGGTLSLSCVTPLGAGAPCSTSDSCQRPLVCPGGGTSANAVCTALPAQGQACIVAYAGEAGACANGLICSTDNTCQTPTYVSPGGACTLATQLCTGGACINGVCVALTGEGSACDTPTTPGCSGLLDCNAGKCVSGTSAETMCGN